MKNILEHFLLGDDEGEIVELHDGVGQADGELPLQEVERPLLGRLGGLVQETFDG